MLYLIGIGLGNEKDLTLNSLEVIKKCKYVYFENYTSNTGFEVKDFEKLINNKIIFANRDLVENETDEILNKAKDSDAAFLVKGDIFGATTHTGLYLRAVNEGIKIKVLHNASILNVIGDTGLMLYNFGKTISIPFENKNVGSAYNNFRNNLSLGMHSLFLLDLKDGKFMNFKDGVNYLLRVENEKKLGIINENTPIVVCCGLGSENSVIKSGKVKDVLKLNLEVYPQCLIIPGKMHFMEEEMLKLFLV